MCGTEFKLTGLGNRSQCQGQASKLVMHAATTPRCPFTGESETDTTRNAIPHTHQKSQMKFVIANYTYV